MLKSDEFARWYSQAGTPTVTVEETEYDETVTLVSENNRKLRRYHLSLSQSTPATPGQPEKLPLLLPVSVGLLDPVTGQSIPIKLLGAAGAGGDAGAAAAAAAGAGADGEYVETVVLRLSQAKKSFTLDIDPAYVAGTLPEADAGGGAGAAEQAAAAAGGEVVLGPAAAAAAAAAEDGAPATAKPVLSILRGWSAPVHLKYDAQTENDLAGKWWLIGGGLVGC